MSPENTEIVHVPSERPSQQKKKPLFGWVTLNPGIKQRNYFAALMHALVLGFILSGVELLQQNLLVSPEYYGFDSKHAIFYNALITLEDLFTKILVTPVYGYMIDKIGRQKSTLISHSLMAIGLALFPLKHYWPSTSLGWFFGVRFIYSNGSAILSNLPLIADYVDDSSKGRAIGFNVLFISVGFSVSTLVLKVLENYDLFYSCMTFTGVMVVLGLGYGSLLKEGNRYYRTNRAPINLEVSHNTHPFEDVNNSSTMDKRSLMKIDLRTKPWIIAGYVFAFMNGTGMAITSQLLNLYVQSFGAPNGRNLGSATVFKANIASTLTSLVIGPLLDFIKPIYIAAVVFSVTILGYCNVWAIKDPSDLPMALIAIGVGIGYSCAQLLTNYLGFKNYRKSIRGLLFAVSNIFIVFAVILVSVVGGALFTFSNRNWPFYIAGGICIVCFVVFLYVYFTRILPSEHKPAGSKVGQSLHYPLLKNLSGMNHGHSSNSFEYKEETGEPLK